MATSLEQRAKQLYEFGPFRVDPDKELLLRGEDTVPLTPKTFQILLVLIRRKKEVVTKDELLKAVWPDTFVEEANLSRNVFLLRKALGESPQDHQYIVTVPGRGYRFAEEVQLVPDQELSIVSATHSKVEVEIKETHYWRLATVAAVLVALVATALRFLIHTRPALTEKDTIVLADFVNSTGDQIFDGTLRQGLAIQLEQSAFLKIMDDTQMQRDLRLMNVQPAVHITNQIAHDICVREGAAATIDGAIASLGKTYVITLEAVTCGDGTTLSREQTQAADKEHILNALDSAATAMRRKLGESLSSIRKLNTPLEEATTPSLEALQNYTTGLSVMKPGEFRAALPFFERAITIDPNFTMAYYMLGVGYEQIGDEARSVEYANRAFSMVDHVSETERTEITAYHYRATGELDKEIDAYELAVRNNLPRQWSFHNQISLTYIDMGQFEAGLKEGQQSAQLQPDVEPPYRRQLDAYICMDRMREADQLATKVRALGIDGSRIHQRFLEMAYLEDDKTAITRETQWFAGKPEEYLSLGLQAADLNLHGRRHESHELYQRAAESALREGFRYVADEFEEADARADALAGACRSVRPLGSPALALAMCGDAADAQKLATDTSKRLPNATIWNAVQLPEIQAIIAMNHGDSARAIELLAPASPYERAYPDAPYVRGLAYLRLHKGMEAVAEFQKITGHKGASWGATWIHPYWGQYYSLAYLGMARGFALAGKKADAQRSFENFFTLWKDADPDIPILKQAKAEYANLK